MTGALAVGVTAEFRPDDTRESYDRVAQQYADRIATELQSKPFDREFLDGFAATVKELGRVVELGCGPAHVAAYLATRGVDIAGLDVSPAMVAQANRLFPGLEVVVGDMLDLPYEDGSLGGVVAFYSIIHFHDGQLSLALSEMERVLRHGGFAAFAFHIGDEVVQRTEWWGEPVTLDARFLPTGHVLALVRDAGFEVTSTTERGPYEPGVEFQSRRAYLVARRP
jgi:SAM-dependent methyltransferase